MSALFQKKKKKKNLGRRIGCNRSRSRQRMKAIGFLVSVNCSHASFTLDAEKSQLLGNSNNNKRKSTN